MTSATRDAVTADAVVGGMERDEWCSQWQEALAVESQWDA